MAGRPGLRPPRVFLVVLETLKRPLVERESFSTRLCFLPLVTIDEFGRARELLFQIQVYWKPLASLPLTHLMWIEHPGHQPFLS